MKSKLKVYLLIASTSAPSFPFRFLDSTEGLRSLVGSSHHVLYCYGAFVSPLTNLSLI